jgi:hypothetical protein
MSAPREIATGGFPASLKEGTGLAVQKDLSHKVSAKQTNTMLQAVAANPTHVHALLPSIQAATDVSNGSAAVNRKLTIQTQYLENHAPYGAAPMSPRSAQAAYDVLNTYANKNEANLRPRPDSENRSIGQFPHMNISGGQLSPRSQTLVASVSHFDQLYGSQLSAQQQRETSAYVNLPQAAASGAGPQSTSDQVAYAMQQRQNK